MKNTWALLNTLWLLGLSFASQAWTVRYQHTDLQGSVIAESNAQGSIQQRYDYKPYGEGTPSQKSGLGYTGHLEDPELGLTYMQQRFYDPVIGRFYSNDPVGFTTQTPVTFSRYAYANNNPYKFTDPDGRASCANSDCSKARIDHEINKGAPSLDSTLPGNPQAATALVTFENDVPGGESSDKPVSTETALMVEATIASSDVDSVNINSTSGGTHSTQSRHYSGKAVDINRVNGSPANSDNSGSAAIQDAASKQSNIRENFGPVSNTKTVEGKTVDYASKVSEDHKTHIHLSGNN